MNPLPAVSGFDRVGASWGTVQMLGSPVFTHLLAGQGFRRTVGEDMTNLTTVLAEVLLGEVQPFLWHESAALHGLRFPSLRQPSPHSALPS